MLLKFSNDIGMEMKTCSSEEKKEHFFDPFFTQKGPLYGLSRVYMR